MGIAVGAVDQWITVLYDELSRVSYDRRNDINPVQAIRFHLSDLWSHRGKGFTVTAELIHRTYVCLVCRDQSSRLR